MKAFKIGEKYVPPTAILYLEKGGTQTDTYSQYEIWKVVLVNGDTLEIESTNYAFTEMQKYFGM